MSPFYDKWTKPLNEVEIVIQTCKNKELWKYIVLEVVPVFLI